MNNQILENDLELLSSYLDGQLSVAEKEQVEARLESDSAYHDEFEKLQRTHLILCSLPQHPVPHNFTLSPELNKKKGYTPSIFQFFRFASAVAALGLMVLLVIDFFPFNRQPILNQRVQIASAPAAAAPIAKSSEPPMIIIWGSSQPEALGKGGGGGVGGGEADSAYAVPQPDIAPSALSSELAAPPAQPISPQLEPSLASPPEDIMAAPESAIGGTGPILGIPSSNERGAIMSTLAVHPISVSTEKMSTIRLSEWVMGIFALFAGVIAFLINKRRVS